MRQLHNHFRQRGPEQPVEGQEAFYSPDKFKKTFVLMPHLAKTGGQGRDSVW
jgi:hypothetical protein